MMLFQFNKKKKKEEEEEAWNFCSTVDGMDTFFFFCFIIFYFNKK